MPSCPSCGHENRDGARFCERCATPIDSGVAANARRTVTILFTDVVGSTELGERLDAERLQAILSRYFDTTREVIERHGGTVEKFIGDAVVAVFGVPRVREDDALRAVRAAAEIARALEEVDDDLIGPASAHLLTRTGVHTGEVVVGDTTVGGKLATGDAMNVAARLEQSAAPDEVLISAATYRLVRDAVQVADVDPIVVKGKSDPIQAYRLVKVDPEALGFARRLSAPMVGRTRELSLLRAAFDRAVSDRACQLFTVLGVGGMGKSRLLGAFVDELGDRATLLRGRCLPYGDGITFWPIVEAIRPAAGLSGSEDAETSLAKIAALIPGDDHADRIARHVAQMMGLEGGEAAPEETFWAIRRLLEGMGRVRPVAFVVDDLQWADLTMLELIEHIADWSVDAPILVACMARPELLESRPAWGGGKLNATSISLEPLSASDCSALVANLLAIDTIEPAVRDRIVEASEGLPLFAEELLAMLVDEGRLVRREEAWGAVGDLSNLSIPPTTSALLAARIDRLSSEERSVLQRASIVGQVFYRDALSSPHGDDVGPVLSSLVRKQFVHPDRSDLSDTDAFAFRHLMIRDAAYEAIPKTERADLHERFADWLEGRAGDRIQEYEEIVAFHLERASRYREELGRIGEHDRAIAARASEHFESAARRATSRIDLPAAASLLARAVGVLDERDPRYPELLWEYGVALNRQGDTEGAFRVLTDVVALAAASQDARLEARARLDLWWAHTLRLVGLDRSDTLMSRDVERLIPQLEAAGDDLGLTKAWQLMAEAHWFSGQLEAMREPLARALVHARRAGDRLEEAEVLTSSLFVDRFGPATPSEAISHCEETLLNGNKDRRLEADILGCEAVARAMLGDFDAARTLIGRQADIIRDLGINYEDFWLGVSTWEVHMLAGDPVAAELGLRASSEELTHGERAHGPDESPVTLARLAHSLCAQGLYDEATTYAPAAWDIRPQGLVNQVICRSASAKAAARVGDPEAALELARQAVALAADTDALHVRGNASMDLADVLTVIGRTAEAIPIVEEAIRLFERKGNLVSTATARDVLAQISGSR